MSVCILDVEICEVRNSDKCMDTVPDGTCSTYFDNYGRARLCCPECDPPVSESVNDWVRRVSAACRTSKTLPAIMAEA